MMYVAELQGVNFQILIFRLEFLMITHNGPVFCMLYLQLPCPVSHLVSRFECSGLYTLCPHARDAKYCADPLVSHARNMGRLCISLITMRTSPPNFLGIVEDGAHAIVIVVGKSMYDNLRFSFVSNEYTIDKYGITLENNKLKFETFLQF